MKKWTLIFAACFAFSGIVFAKEIPPAGGTPKDFALTATESITLENGLIVTFVPYGNTPKVTLRLVTKTGNYADNGKDGISDLAFNLLTEGTSNRNALEIAEEAANMGGEIGTSVGMNSSFIQLDVLSEFVGQAAELVADVALNAKIQQADLDRERTNFLRGIQVQRSQAGGQANEAFFKAIYGEHPYSMVFPNDDAVNSISIPDVTAFLKENLVAKRSHLYISGKFDQGSAKKAVEAAFAGMASGEKPDIKAPEYNGKAGFVFVEREAAPQSTIRLGLPVVDPSHNDYIGLQLMNSLLGGSFSSRITANIREDKGYTYSPSSTVSTRVKSALWYQGADVTAESTAASLFEIIKEVKRLQDEPPTEEELQGFKNYIAGIYVLQNSSRTAIINQLWFLESHGLPLSRLETYVQKISAITPGQLSKLANQYLNLENMTLVVVGDGASVKPQLEAEETLSTWVK